MTASPCDCPAARAVGRVVELATTMRDHPAAALALIRVALTHNPNQEDQ